MLAASSAPSSTENVNLFIDEGASASRRRGTLQRGRAVGMSLVCALVLATGAEGAAVPFNSQQVLSTSADSPESVFAGDVDGDGDLDLLSASSGDDEIAWYENDGAADPSFTRIVISTESDSPRSVSAGDVDGDGDLDLLSASFFDGEIAWYENDGAADPSFTRIIISTAAVGAQSVHSGDVDGDGDLDLLSASSGNSEIAWYENDGAADPSFTRIVVSAQALGAQSVYAGDVDGDGDLDLMSASATDDSIAWYENDGAADPSFTRIVISTEADFAHSVHAGDLDGDGDLDLISTSRSDGEMAWYENDGAADPSFTRRLILSLANGIRPASAGDVDGDGDLDLISATQFDDAVAWYENDGAAEPSFSRIDITAAADGAFSVHAGDIDGDGDLDLMSASALDDKIAWYENETIHRSAVYPEQTVISTAANGARSVQAGDVDGDGDLDLMSASFNDDAIAWYENDGAADPSLTRITITTAANGANSVHGGDVDGDGDLDLMSASFSDDAIAWYENDGGADPSFARIVISTASDGAQSVAAGDVDGDGDLDLMSASFNDDAIAWYENDGGADPSFTRFVVTTAADGANSVSVGDVDGDGDLDLMSASVFDHAIAWYENDGAADPSFTRIVISTEAEGARSVHAGDMDGDGDLDLLSASELDDEIAWYENDGAAEPSFTRILISTEADGAYSVSAGDVDGDGDLDVMSASGNDDTIAWFENDGSADPSFTRIVVSTAADDPRSVVAGDLDGDGDLDLMSASSDDQRIAWYENRGGQLGLPTTDVAQGRTISSATVAALEIDAIHRGRPGDQDIELVTLELALEDGAGSPLTGTQVDALLTELAVYLDDGSGDFDAGSDTKAATISSFSLDAGVLTVSFADADPNVQIPISSPKKYFVGLTTEPSASSAVPDEIRVTHRTEASSTGEDADHDLPITLELSPDVASSVIEVNDAPAALDDAVSLLEDGGTVSGNVLDGTSGGLDSDEELDPLTAALAVGPSNGTLVAGLAPDGSFVYRPNPNFNGIDSFTYVASDGFESSNTATVTITVSPVNDAPVFSMAALHGSSEDGGPQTVAGFATGISPGPADESGQSLTFNIVSNDNPELFFAAPALAKNGTLTYTADADANGTATVMVQLMDDGGTENGGVDTSAPQSFDLVIGAINDPPSFTVPASVAVEQDMGDQSFPAFATDLSPGPIDEAAQSLTFNLTANSDPALFSVAPALAGDGTLTFASAPSAAGIATVAFELMDDGGTENGGVDTSAPKEFDIEIRDLTLPQVTTLEALPGGTIEECTELDRSPTALVVSFTEPMADPPGDSDPEDVTNPDNYQLIASGRDNDLGTTACDALAEDDVQVAVTGVTYDEVARQATVLLPPRLGDGPYRLLVCDALEDPTGNALSEELVVTFRQDVNNLLIGGPVDCDLDDWELVSTTPEEIEYSAEDIDDASVSGSVQMTNRSGTSFAIGQCVDTIEASFRVGANLRIDGAADLLIDATMACDSFAQAGCLGGALDQASSSQVLGETAGRWRPLSLTFDVPAASVSLFCTFSLDQQEGGVFNAFFDNLTLGGDLFSDGFESGDISAWSSSSP